MSKDEGNKTKQESSNIQSVETAHVTRSFQTKTRFEQPLSP